MHNSFKMLSQVNEILRKAYAPVVLVLESPDATQLVEQCCKQRSVAKLLQPFNVVDDSKTVRFASLNSLNQTEYPETLPADNRALDTHHELTEEERRSPVARVQALRSAAGREPFASPWFVQYAATLVDGFGASKLDFVSHPAVLVLCCTTDCEDPVKTLSELYNSQKPPQIFDDFEMESQLSMFYLLLHKSDSDAKATKRADQLLKELETTFGAKSCALLPIRADESKESAASESAASSSEDRVKKRTSRRQKRRNQNNHSNQSIASATDVNNTIVIRTLDSWLTSEESSSLRNFIANVLQVGVIAPYKRQAQTLYEHVSHKRSKISTLRGWLSGGKGKSKKDSAVGDGRTPRTLEAQTRRLADLQFILKDFEGAGSHYRAAAGDFKNEKAHAAYASSQEMAAAALLAELLASSEKRSHARREHSAAVAHLHNAVAGYERANETRRAQRVAVILQAILRDMQQHIDAAAVCVRAAEAAGDDGDVDDELFQATMQEQAALACLYNTPHALFRRCLFRLVVAGTCYSNAGQRAHAVRCFAFAHAAYEASGWKLINDELVAALVRHYALAGRLERALHFALALLQAHGAAPAWQQASHLREFLQLHKAVHGAGGTYGMQGEETSAAARAIASYHATASVDEDGDDPDEDTFDDDTGSMSRTTSQRSSGQSPPATPRTSSASLLVDVEPPPLPLPIVHGDVAFVFKDTGRRAASPTNINARNASKGNKPFDPMSMAAAQAARDALVAAQGGGANALGTCNDHTAPWPMLESRLLRTTRASVADKLPAGTKLQAAWQANGGAKYRPIGVVNEVIAVTASVTNPLSIPIQLSRVRLLVGHEPLEGGALNGGIDAEGKATFEVQRVSQLLPPESTVSLRVTLTPKRVGILHVRGLAFTVAGTVDGAYLFEQGEQNDEKRDDKAQHRRAHSPSNQIVVAPPMPLLTTTFKNVPTHLCTGEMAQAQLTLRNSGQRALRRVYITCATPQLVTLFDKPRDVSAASGEQRLRLDDDDDDELNDDLSVPPFCAHIPLPDDQLAPGEEHTVSIWLRGSDDVRSTSLSFVIYYEPINNERVPNESPAVHDENKPLGGLTYRMQHVEANIYRLPSLALSYTATARLNHPAERLLRLKAQNTLGGSVIRLRAIASRSPHWVLESLSTVPINDLILRPGETTSLLFRAAPNLPLPSMSLENNSEFTNISLNDNDENDNDVDADDEQAVNANRAAQVSLVQLYTPDESETRVALDNNTAPFSFFLDADVRQAAMLAGAAEPCNAPQPPFNTRMPNWCDVVLFWELVNVDKTKTASSPRIGFTSLIDVNLTRGILASSVNQTAATRKRARQTALLSSAGVIGQSLNNNQSNDIDSLRFEIQAPARVEHCFDKDGAFCVIPITLIIANSSMSPSSSFEIELMTPEEALWSGDDGNKTTSGTATRTRRRQTTLASSDAVQRIALANAAANKAAGPGTGGGGGARARGSVMWIGSTRRSVTSLAPQSMVRVSLLASVVSAGVHNLSRVRLRVGTCVVPPDVQTLIVVDDPGSDNNEQSKK